MGYKEQTYELLKDFKQGLIDDETFLKKLRSSEYTDLGFAMIDHERSLRQGFAEVVYCEGKTAEQTAAIMSRLAEVHSNIIGTRANEEKFAAVKKAVPDAEYYKDAGFIKIERNPLPKDEKRYIAVVTAGTSDLRRKLWAIRLNACMMSVWQGFTVCFLKLILYAMPTR